jgi:S-layer protein
MHFKMSLAKKSLFASFFPGYEYFALHFPNHTHSTDNNIMTTAASYSNLVQDLYVAYFGRPADYFGLQNFEAALAAADAPTDAAGLSAAYSTNSAVKTLVDSFGTSAESTALYGGNGNGSTASFVNAVFENLFNRPAAVAGLSFWVNAIDSGQVSKGDAALAILAGAFDNNTVQGKADQSTINNKVAVASNFTADLGTASDEIVAYHGADAAAVARLLLAGVNSATNPATYDVTATIASIANNNNANTYTLTTGLDAVVGGSGNDVFNATLGGSAPTWQSFDTITGGTRHNTLNVNDFGIGSTMALPTGATTSGITTLNINSLETVDSDFSGWSMLTNLNVTSTGGDITVEAGNSTVVNVTDTASGLINVKGGSAITVNENHDNGSVTVEAGVGATTLVVRGGAQVSASDGNWGSAGQTLSTVSLSYIGNGGATLSSDALSSLSIANSEYGLFAVDTDTHAGARTLNVTLNGDHGIGVEDDQASTITVTSSTAASDYDAVVSKSATALAISNNVDSNFVVFQTPDVKAVTITGAGEFDISYLLLATGAVVDASASSGKIGLAMVSVWGGDPTQSFIGGTGQDTIAIGTTQTGTITGGSAHNNEIMVGAIGGSQYVTEAALASVTNFQILGVDGGVYGTFDMANLKGQAYNGFDVEDETAGSIVFQNITPDSNLALTLQGTNAYSVELNTADKAGVGETISVTIGSDSIGPATLSQLTLSDATQDGIGTVNFISNSGSATDVNDIGTLGDSGLRVLNIGGDAQMQIDSFSMTGASLTINSTGAWFGSDDLNAVNLSALTIAGTSDVDITNLETSVTSLTINDTSTGVITLDGLHDANLTNATFTQSAGSSKASLSIDGFETAATSLATLTLNGNVAIVVGNDIVTTGVTVSGSTDNSDVSFSGAGASVTGVTDHVTLGNGDDTVFFDGGIVGTTQTVVLGNGSDNVVTLNDGTVNVTVGTTTGTDAIMAYQASNLHVSAGNGTNMVFDQAAGATINITVGSGANTINLGESATGTVTLGAHSATTADMILVGASGTGAAQTPLIVIRGLNSGTSTTGVDQIVFSGDSLSTVTGVLTLNSTQVSGDPTNLASWVAAADGAAFNAAAHNVVTFQFQGNTYLMETVFGGAADAGGVEAQNTLVELVGTGYTFAHSGLGMVNGHAAMTLMG